MSKTPWADYTTSRPERITCWRDSQALMIGAGDVPSQSPSITINFLTGDLLFLSPKARQPRVVQPYRLKLSRWTYKTVPKVCLHPLALVHLLKTAQAPRKELLAGALSIGESALFYSQTLTTSCEVLDMLGVPRAVLAFATTYNLAVRAM